ncbi:endonuclease/exonuclease/phosphatase family protein [Streptomyces sp. NPDC002082]|uniref:endonuclease/exonuclease/phosphatase family protein n=1 Tax=Streptomyces sp. NPDC002082 TaxID=3154772 RepID=UPI00332FDF0A
MAVEAGNAERHELVVASWNLHEGVSARAGAGPADAEVLAEVTELLTDRRVDVVAFQEVGFDAEGSSELLSRVRETTALRHVVAFPLHASSFFPGRLGGVALAGRFPWRDARRVLLPNPGLSAVVGGNEIHSHDKGLVHATCRWGGRDLGVTSLHSFPFYLFGRDPGEAEFKGIWDALAADVRRSARSGPALVCGDFNTGDRALVLDRGSLPLSSATAGRVTYPRGAVDDVLHTADAGLPLRAEAITNFSDHKVLLCAFGNVP